MISGIASKPLITGIDRFKMSKSGGNAFDFSMASNPYERHRKTKERRVWVRLAPAWLTKRRLGYLQVLTSSKRTDRHQ